MEAIKAKALQKGLMITQFFCNDNQEIIINGVKVGRVYQDNHKAELRITNSMKYEQVAKIFKEIYDLDLTYEDWKKWNQEKYNDIVISKVDFFLFGGAIWNLLK